MDEGKKCKTCKHWKPRRPFVRSCRNTMSDYYGDEPEEYDGCECWEGTGGRVMSYDLRIAVKVQDTDICAVIAEPEYSSPTYNIGEMFRKATGWDFEQGKWYKVSDVLPLIEHGIHELRYNEDKYKQYDSPNGWGTTQSARKALESLAKCIEEQTNGWEWQRIPLEHLYVAW